MQGKMMQSTLHCLQQAVHNVTSIYTEAVLAYAFALAGDYETTQELLYKLEEQAIKSGRCWLLVAVIALVHLLGLEQCTHACCLARADKCGIC